MNHYQTTFATWDKLALQYQQNFMDLDLYNDTYDIFCNSIKKVNASIFEIGCGPGNITKYLLAKRSDVAIDATDVSPNMIALAKQNNPTINAAVMDARTIDSITKNYDGIMCGFCLPYLSKEDYEKLVMDCFTLLNEGGVLYCSAIEGSYSQSGFETSSTGDKAYVYYYEENYLIEQLQKKGFTNLQTIRKQYSKKDGSTQTHLIIIAIKG